MRLELPLKETDHELVIQEEGDIKVHTEDLKQFWQAKKGDFLVISYCWPSQVLQNESNKWQRQCH